VAVSNGSDIEKLSTLSKYSKDKLVFLKSMACLYGRPFFPAVDQMLPVSQLKNIGQTIFYELNHKSLSIPLKWQG
jgi:hypothetical protein